MQALTLFFASALFFTCRAIWAGAHWSSGTQGRRMLVLFGVALAVDVALFAWKFVGVHRVSVWQGRAAGDDFLLVVETIFFVVVAATVALRLRRERREELAGDAE